MPMFMRFLWRFKTAAFGFRVRLRLRPQESRLRKHAIHRSWARCHNIGIEHLIRERTIAFAQMLLAIRDDGRDFAWQEPMPLRHASRDCVFHFAPRIISRVRKCEPHEYGPHCNARAFVPIREIVHDLAAQGRGKLAAIQLAPTDFFNLRFSSKSSAMTSLRSLSRSCSRAISCCAESD